MDLFETKKNSIADVVLSMNNVSKSNIDSIAEQVCSSVLNGNEYAITAYIKAKALEEISSSIQSKIKQYAIDEAEKSGPESKIFGCGVSVKSTANKYDYSGCEEWVNLNNQIKELTERKKALEKQMVLAMNYSEMVDEDGVVVIPAKLEKGGSTTIAIKIPK
jgi:hypothetical protein